MKEKIMTGSNTVGLIAVIGFVVCSGLPAMAHPGHDHKIMGTGKGSADAEAGYSWYAGI